MRWRNSQRLDWAAIASSVCAWDAARPGRRTEQAIADLRLPFPANREMISFVLGTLHRARAVTPVMLEVPRWQLGYAYTIGRTVSGQLTARCLHCPGELVTHRRDPPR
jgi:hypothetical protein